MSEIGVKNQVWQRLETPLNCSGQRLSFAQFYDIWQGQDLSLTLKGYGVLAGHKTLLFKLRGAIGTALLRGASAASKRGDMCLWSPPCANDVFFGSKPVVDLPRGRQEIPKPFVLSAKSFGQDLVLTISVFGFANEWITELRSAFLIAVNEFMPWPLLGRDLFLPRKLEFDVSVQPIVIRSCPMVYPDRITLNFLTPLDIKNYDPSEQPQSLIAGLARRLLLMARWQDVEIDTSVWEGLVAAWRGLDYDVDGEPLQLVKRRSRRTDQSFEIETQRFELILSGNLEPFWPILAIGEHIHIGRGTNNGLGRFVLDLTD